MSTLGFREAIPTILLLVTMITVITFLRFTIINICNISMSFFIPRWRLEAWGVSMLPAWGRQPRSYDLMFACQDCGHFWYLVLCSLWALGSGLGT